MKRTHRGFTLIELLVVIAIIAILAAILFPVFAQAREKARAITCASNTKQLALAITMYEQDFDEYTPPGFGLYSRGTGWAGQVFPYVKSVKAFECPDDSAATGNFTSYGININLSASAVGYVSTVSGAPYYGAGIPLWQGKSIATLNSPSKTVMLFEVSGSQAYPAHQGFPDYDITQPDEGAPSNESTMFFTGGSATGDGTAGGYSPEGAGEWDHTTPYSAAQLQTLLICNRVSGRNYTTCALYQLFHRGHGTT